MTYYYKGNNIANFVVSGDTSSNIVGTNVGTVYTSFPGSSNTQEQIFKPLNFGYNYTDYTVVHTEADDIYSYFVVSLNSLRGANYQDFLTSDGVDVQCILSPPANTTHISGILIGGGGGGGGAGGGNNPSSGSDRAGSGGGSGGSGAQVFFYKYPYNSNLRIVLGSGGTGGTCTYKQNGSNGSSGNATYLINSSNTTLLILANGGSGGSGGISGSANAHASTAGAGGAGGSADFKNNTANTYLPVGSCTKNAGVTGNNGSLYSSTNNKSEGGKSVQPVNLDNVGKVYSVNGAPNWGTSGSGGTNTGTGSGSSANSGNGSNGTNGYARIYYLIE